MVKIFKTIGKFAAYGAVFGGCSVLAAIGVAYALSYQWNDPSALRGTVGGNVLSSSKWNLLVGNVDNLNERLSSAETNGGIVPSGAVMAFYGTACPSGWSPADGTANGVKKTDGTAGTLDLRGEFIRGLDGTRGVDSGRTLASWQKPSIFTYHSDGNTTPFITSPYDAGANANATYGVEDPNTNGYASTSLTRVEITGTSYTYATSSNNIMFKALRPRNVALLYCVKN